MSLALFTVFTEPISIKLFCCSSSVITRKKMFIFLSCFCREVFLKQRLLRQLYRVLRFTPHATFPGSIWRQFSKSFKPALVPYPSLSSNSKYCRNKTNLKDTVEEVAEHRLLEPVPRGGCSRSWHPLCVPEPLPSSALKPPQHSATALRGFDYLAITLVLSVGVWLKCTIWDLSVIKSKR